MRQIRFKVKTYKVMGWDYHNGVVAYQYIDARNMVEAIKIAKKNKNSYIKKYKTLKWKATKI
jgi:hypothetical protein